MMSKKLRAPAMNAPYVGIAKDAFSRNASMALNMFGILPSAVSRKFSEARVVCGFYAGVGRSLGAKEKHMLLRFRKRGSTVSVLVIQKFGNKYTSFF